MNFGVIRSERVRVELLDFHCRAKCLKKRGHTVFAVADAIPGCSSRGSFRGPIDIVCHTLDDRLDIPLSESLVNPPDRFNFLFPSRHRAFAYLPRATSH